MRLLISVILAITIGLSSPARRNSPGFRGNVVTYCSAFDEYGDLRFKDEKMRLDIYAEQLKRKPETSALVLVYASGDVPFRRAKTNALRSLDYLVNKRGADSEHIAAAIVEDRNHKEFMLRLFTCPPLAIDALTKLFEGKSEIIKGVAIKKPRRE